VKHQADGLGFSAVDTRNIRTAQHLEVSLAVLGLELLPRFGTIQSGLRQQEHAIQEVRELPRGAIRRAFAFGDNAQPVCFELSGYANPLQLVERSEEHTSELQ